MRTINVPPGGSATFSLVFSADAATRISGFDFVLTFDQTRFTALTPTRGSGILSGGFTFDAASNVPGQLTGSSGAGDASLASGTITELANFAFTSIPGQSTSITDINLKAIFNGFVTDILDFDSVAPIKLTPAVTNDFDEGVDAKLAYSVSVPEPASWTLLGVGGSLGLILARRRSRHSASRGDTPPMRCRYLGRP